MRYEEGETLESFHCRHSQSTITVEKLDTLMEFSMNPKKGKLSWVVHCIKLISVFAYIYTRQQIIKNTWETSKQLYIQDTSLRNKSEVDRHSI